MKLIGKFQSQRWGEVEAHRAHYLSEDGPVAVLLTTPDGEHLATLSVNLEGHSKYLPENCFYVKDWSENDELADEARQSGLFKARPDISRVHSGFVVAGAWEIVA